ncbi:MAG: type IX secretion system membrane protein PorP/SprF [Saprospiraceae bacterium]|nr:type IX secretion system membrane protein PorP/SprF [Saprospiraceae bacterium]MCF8250178.1 type IX secretion system membrane protein PorP/SprF [Saprospiraceae bacterium]MCF8279441.1 type IX secretion system membrane protein PorP/SprF [Bacteroidales bacterium]MCF8311232.1 type IX secretion system membrane protein PorP/SprF [Saprospiraceae bacterium]MCF8440388.1 type IX secretion system membrane protein PorP/SprF [Saprospiraceae bacterium]
MKKIILLPILVFVGLAANAQDLQSLRASLMQYQFNALPLNPAYAGRLEATSFEAYYYGSFASQQQVSRSAMVSLHGRGGASQQLGWGGVFQFHNQEFYNELNIRPAFSRIIRLPKGNFSFGGTLGISYFDVDETVISSLNSSFLSMDGGVGAFYHNQRSFIGVSVLSFFEKTFLSGDDNSGSLPRSRPINLHMGSLFRLNDELYLKPTMLLRYASVYGIPEQNSMTDYSLWSADVHASVFVEGTYVIGLLAGYTKPEQGYDQTRLGLSATLLFGNFRLGYAIQYNNQAASSVSLPASHTISAGYDFFDDPAEGRRVF